MRVQKDFASYPPATKCAHDLPDLASAFASEAPSGCLGGVASPNSRDEGGSGALSRKLRGPEASCSDMEGRKTGGGPRGLVSGEAHGGPGRGLMGRLDLDYAAGLGVFNQAWRVADALYRHRSPDFWWTGRMRLASGEDYRGVSVMVAWHCVAIAIDTASCHCARRVHCLPARHCPACTPPCGRRPPALHRASSSAAWTSSSASPTMVSCRRRPPLACAATDLCSAQARGPQVAPQALPADSLQPARRH